MQARNSSLLHSITLDSQGFLSDRSQWNRDVANALAEQDELALTPDHWEVIDIMRAFYAEFHTSPAIRAVVKLLKNRLGPAKGNSLYLQTLFPKGAAKQAARIAGLPKPVKCT